MNNFVYLRVIEFNYLFIFKNDAALSLRKMNDRGFRSFVTGTKERVYFLQQGISYFLQQDILCFKMQDSINSSVIQPGLRILSSIENRVMKIFGSNSW